MMARDAITRKDMKLFHVTDDAVEAVGLIKQFYDDAAAGKPARTAGGKSTKGRTRTER